jgi:hypothetical protein
MTLYDFLSGVERGLLQASFLKEIPKAVHS